ncbi:aldehyde oxidase [Tateyamaria omphalii]|uniref:aldo/keto reductase n=1 Tax=Tateyamaria omphalii TaxID=299262 RepID=UPI0019994598|nr:aldo/keto reductase [Tateyamaria omphalii]GGX47376.1 aldehyde oxidase [Tateyamaria omphalii]
MSKSINPTRRSILTAAAAALAVGSLSPTRTVAQAMGSVTVPQGRRMLGALEVSAIGLGVQNHSRTFHTTIPNRAEMHNIIRTAVDRGVTFIDTAEVYGPHESERILGEVAGPIRDQIQIATKFGFNVDLETGQWAPGLISDPSHIKQAVEGSLRRLRTDRIDLLYQHRVDPTVPIEDVAGAVRDLMDEGKVLHWGLSEMGPNTLRRAHAELPVAAVQNEYSMLWRGPEDGLLDLCDEMGIGFVPFSPLGYGFLTGAIDMATSFAPGDFRANTTRMHPENRAANMALVELVKAWGERKSAAPGQIALAWLMAQGQSIVPIPGTTQMPHLLENIASIDLRFSSAEQAELNGQVAAIEVQGARMPAMVAEWSNVEAPVRN